MRIGGDPNVPCLPGTGTPCACISSGGAAGNSHSATGEGRRPGTPQTSGCVCGRGNPGVGWADRGGGSGSTGIGLIIGGRGSTGRGSTGRGGGAGSWGNLAFTRGSPPGSAAGGRGDPGGGGVTGA